MGSREEVECLRRVFLHSFAGCLGTILASAEAPGTCQVFDLMVRRGDSKPPALGGPLGAEARKLYALEILMSPIIASCAPKLRRLHQ